jgi:hypothetical protein
VRSKRARNRRNQKRSRHVTPFERAAGKTRSGSIRPTRILQVPARPPAGSAGAHYAHLFFIHAPSSSLNSLLERWFRPTLSAPAEAGRK